MSACSRCGSSLAASARFCPECGTRVGGDTVVEQVPPDETGQVPVTFAAQPRFFGVTPPMTLFALAVASLALGLLFPVAGHWVIGIVLLAVAAAFFWGYLGSSRPEAIDRLRARAGFAVEALQVQSAARRDLVRLRYELAELVARRGEELRRLGEAVYGDDEPVAGEAKARLRELDEDIAAKEAEMTTIATEAEQRLSRSHNEVRQTELLEPPSQPDIPEPSPPPDEGTPPGPAIVPEPGPPPDEGTPPTIPEPAPPQE